MILMIKNYLKQWNVMRLIRLLLGLAIIVQGIWTKENAFIMLGIFFAALPLLNIGCCSTGGCSVNTQKTQKPASDVTFEEIK